MKKLLLGTSFLAAMALGTTAFADDLGPEKGEHTVVPQQKKVTTIIGGAITYAPLVLFGDDALAAQKGTHFGQKVTARLSVKAKSKIDAWGGTKVTGKIGMSFSRDNAALTLNDAHITFADTFGAVRVGLLAAVPISIRGSEAVFYGAHRGAGLLSTGFDEVDRALGGFSKKTVIGSVANGVVYETPDFLKGYAEKGNSLTLRMSYIHDGGQQRAELFDTENKVVADRLHETAATLDWKFKYGKDFCGQFAAGATFSDFQNKDTDNIFHYFAGLGMNYKGFFVSGTWSHLAKGVVDKEDYSVGATLGYLPKDGNWSTTVNGYYSKNTDKDKLLYLNADVSYKVAPNITTSAFVGYADGNAAVKADDRNIGVAGVKVGYTF